MPKIKVRKTASKRVTVTGTGALRRRRAGLSHKLTQKSSAKKNAANKPAAVSHADTNRLKKMLNI